jgi:hypothetical protein
VDAVCFDVGHWFWIFTAIAVEFVTRHNTIFEVEDIPCTLPVIFIRLQTTNLILKLPIPEIVNGDLCVGGLALVFVAELSTHTNNVARRRHIRYCLQG